MAEDKNTRASQPVLKIKKWGKSIRCSEFLRDESKKRESKERGNRVETLQPKGIIKNVGKQILVIFHDLLYFLAIVPVLLFFSFILGCCNRKKIITSTKHQLFLDYCTS